MGSFVAAGVVVAVTFFLEEKVKDNMITVAMASKKTVLFFITMEL
jgi:hypothetical protein